MNYIKRHWCGELSLAKSFWVNFVLITFVLGMVRILTHFLRNEAVIIAFRIEVLHFFACILLVYPWQIVGLWRACNARMINLNRWLVSRMIQLIIVISVITNLTVLILVSPLVLFYTKTAFFQNPEDFYTLQVINEGKVLFFEGRIVPGLSSDVKKVINKNPRLEAIILTTQGGKSKEGKRLANLISKNQFDTYVIDYCFSAGTYSFLAGKVRYIKKDAFVGFHQSGFPDYLSWGDLDKLLVEATEDDMEALCLSKGIKKEFIDQMKSVPHEEIWLPTVQVLLDAGVIHGVVDEDLKIVETFSLEDDQCRDRIKKNFIKDWAIKLYEPR